jgi:hypothetical protein
MPDIDPAVLQELADASHGQIKSAWGLWLSEATSRH